MTGRLRRSSGGGRVVRRTRRSCGRCARRCRVGRSRHAALGCHRPCRREVWRAVPGPPSAGADRGEGVQQRHHDLRVVNVRGGDQDSERKSGPVAEDMDLRAGLPRSTGFGPVASPFSRPGPRSNRPPPLDQSTPLITFNRVTNAACSRSHSPAFVHSANRRRTVARLVPNIPAAGRTGYRRSRSGCGLILSADPDGDPAARSRRLRASWSGRCSRTTVTARATWAPNPSNSAVFAALGASTRCSQAAEPKRQIPHSEALPSGSG
jgi:hypothetical protein